MIQRLRTVLPTLCLFAATIAGMPLHAQNALQQGAGTGLTEYASVTDERDQPAIATRLVASHASVVGGQTIQLGWEFKLNPHWHIYWKNAGDSGIPPKLKPHANKAEPLALTFPTPKAIALEPLMNYGYENAVTFTTNYTVPAGLAQGLNVIPFEASFLYCKDVCMPGRVEFKLPLNVTAKPSENKAFQATTNLPIPLPERSPIMAEATGQTVQLTLPLNLADPSVRFIPDEDGVINDSAPQNLTGNVLSIQLDPQADTPPEKLSGLLLINGQGYSFETPLQQTGIRGISSEETPQPPQSSTTELSFISALAFAFLGGLLLNLMPCVLPVLSLKLLSLVKHHHGSSRTNHTLAYAAGVVLSFWAFSIILAIVRHTGNQIGWGFHLQNPVMVAALVFLMVTVAFNFFGMFELGQRLSRLAAAPANPHTGGGRSALAASFATGVLAVVVATPCTVPFMGGAMAYALTQSFAESLLVFTTLGLGMAMPFLIAIPYPKVFQWLPKPGKWMSSFRHALGWPMLATALWLAYVFTSQTGQAGLFLLLSILLAFVFSLWLMGSKPSRATKTLPVLIFISSLFGINHFLNRPQLVVWQPWSTAAVEQALTGENPVFVEFTADWCITCKVTEATVLNTTAVQKLFTETRTTLFRADWTNQNPEITAELSRHNRKGVPLYLLYTKGKPAEVLPQLLTYSVLEEKLKAPKAP